jgi:hypothetical protein
MTIVEFHGLGSEILKHSQTTIAFKNKGFSGFILRADNVTGFFGTEVGTVVRGVFHFVPTVYFGIKVSHSPQVLIIAQAGSFWVLG